MIDNNRILIAGGDSFIYGLDMLDCNPSNGFSYSRFTWPALLAKHLNREYICAAYPGQSNSAISRRTILACEKNLDKELFVVVGWSFLNRFEFRFSLNPYAKEFDAQKDPEGYALGPYGPWISFNIKDLYGDKKRKDLNLISRIIDPDADRFLKDYYRYVGSDDVWEYYSTLKEILYLQNYLKLKNIPFLFTSANCFFRKKIQEENIDCLLKQIDLNHWFFYPTFNGFVQWSNEQGYPRRDEHPSEEAHQAAFTLIRDYLDTENKKILA